MARAPQTRDTELERLKRRYERERRARLEAERIAEERIRALYEAKREVELLGAVAEAANASVSLRQALESVLRHVCEYAGWSVGHAYVVHEHADGVLLNPAGAWYTGDGARFEGFKAVTEHLRFVPGVGLPGTVLAAKRPRAIAKLADDAHFLRRDAAARAGLVSGFGYPVLVRDDVVAVIEFYSDVESLPDARRVQLLAQIGVQLGRVFEREREQRLYFSAHHDALTKLPNRALLEDRMMHALNRVRRRGGHHVGVLFIDVDGLKHVNDTFGHSAGDELLVEFSDRLARCIRAVDTLSRQIDPSTAAAREAPPIDRHGESGRTVARLGGDEFIVLLEDLESPEEAKMVAARIERALDEPFEVAGQRLDVSASIGISTTDAATTDPDALLQAADADMYRAKRASREAGRAEPGIDDG